MSRLRKSCRAEGAGLRPVTVTACRWAETSQFLGASAGGSASATPTLTLFVRAASGVRGMFVQRTGLSADDRGPHTSLPRLPQRSCYWRRAGRWWAAQPALHPCWHGYRGAARSDDQVREPRRCCRWPLSPCSYSLAVGDPGDGLPPQLTPDAAPAPAWSARGLSDSTRPLGSSQSSWRPRAVISR